MIPLPIARIIVDYMLFLDQCDEETLDLRDSNKRMEGIQYYLLQLDKPALRATLDAFAAIADEYRGEAQAFVRNIGLTFYLEDELAEDDPAQLAEIEARRDAAGL